MPARVLHIIYSLDRGGAEAYLMDVLRRYDRQRLHMDVCYLAPQPGAWAHEARALGATLRAARESHLLYPLYRRFAALLRRHPYDAVCFHGEQYLPCALLAAAKNRVPGLTAFLHTTQCFARMRPKHRLYHHWLMAVLKRLQPTIVCASEAIAQAHFPGPLRRQFHVHVIHYGIDTHRFAPASGHRAAVRAELHLPPDAPVIGHVGRFHPAKNHAGFIRAAALIAAARPDARFVLVGDGLLRPQIRQQIQQAHLADRFVLTGVRPDVERILGAFDLLLFPSHWEGLPIAVLEAQAARVPVVASRIQPMREACPPQNQSLLHDPNDHPALAQSALTLLNHPAQAAVLTDAAAQWVQQHFDIHTSVAKFSHLLQTACQHPATQSPRTQ